MVVFSDEQKKLFERIDVFQRRLLDHEYEFSQGATLGFAYGYHTKSLADGLSESLQDYEISKDHLEDKVAAAHRVEFWINYAFSSGLVTLGGNVFKKLQFCAERVPKLEGDITKLQEDNAKLSADYLILKGKYEECQRNQRIKPMGKEDH